LAIHTLELTARTQSLVRQASDVSVRVSKADRGHLAEATIRGISPRSLAWVAFDRTYSSQRKSRPSCLVFFKRMVSNKLYRCWDGVNLDSPDHKSHVTYPINGSFEGGSPCPASHPVRLPQLFYEIMWNTTEFNNLAEWPEDGSQPFVFSTGDP
jgi:hypothetical protein